MERNEIIDALPYIDQKPDEDIVNKIEKMIEKEMKKIDKKKIEKKINEKYKKIKESTTPQIKLQTDNDKKKFLETPNQKLVTNIEHETEKLRIENFNLEQMNKYGIKQWEKYLLNLRMVNSQLKKEKEKMQNQITLINKKRKLNSLSYEKDLNKLNTKIKNEKDLIYSLENELYK